MSQDSPEDGATNPRFSRLQEELRHVVINGVSSFGPASWIRPEEEMEHELIEQGVSKSAEEANLTLSDVNIPLVGAARYLQNWVTECAPLLDKFDEEQNFQNQVPILAQQSPALLYALLAFSSKHMERRGMSEGSGDSLELYQESITLLGPTLKAKEPKVLVTACVLAVFELMSGSSKNWRRHLEGCAALFRYFGVHGFSGGLLQAVFWCFARMDLCGSILAGGTESMTLPLAVWHPVPSDALSQSAEAVALFVQNEFRRHSRDNPDAHANWSVYLCAKVCDLRFRRTQVLELGQCDLSDARPYKTQWKALWDELAFWRDKRPTELIPVVDDMISGEKDLFPRILFAHWAAISSNQLYHTACILMLEMRPINQMLPAPEVSEIWHARRVCGISSTNPHRGSLVNAIQPLYVAGRLFTHASERREIARLLKLIDSSTGWGALWRLRDLESAWGETYNDMSGT